MNTENRILIAGDFERVFALASQIERWPEILPHYRWVTVLNRKPDEIIVEMAARHNGVPLWWRSTQRVKPNERRIEFTHIAGITKGMDVQWTFENVNTKASGIAPVWLVEIHHQFSPAWVPIVGPWFADHVVGRRFVQPVANKTLKRIKQLVERPMETAHAR